MRDYSKVSPKFWTGETGQALAKRGSDALVVALYLMSSPHSNMLGLYYQPVLYIAEETGLSPEGASEGLRACIEEGFCHYDHATKMVWVVEMASFQIGSELKTDDKRCKGIQKDYNALPNCPFLGAFFERYAVDFHLGDRREFVIKTKGLALVITSPSEAPSKPGTGAGTGTSTGEGAGTGTGAASQAAPRPRREATTLKTYLQDCREAGTKPVPDDHAIRAYCRDAGITEEMLQVAWCVFRDDYTAGTNKAKRYKDWPGHFANAVRGCWAKLWFTDAGEVKWSSRGLQEKQVLEARMKAKEGGHAPG